MTRRAATTQPIALAPRPASTLASEERPIPAEVRDLFSYEATSTRSLPPPEPLVEYQREGYALFQSMMGQIREESIGFLYNLEVEVNAAGAAPQVQARGLGQQTASAEQLSYTAPSEEGDGGVEVRNERGQVDRAATQRAQRAAMAQAVALQEAQAREAGRAAPAAGGAQQSGSGGRGAFGQRTEGAADAAPQNRAQRRANDRKK